MLRADRATSHETSKSHCVARTGGRNTGAEANGKECADYREAHRGTHLHDYISGRCVRLNGNKSRTTQPQTGGPTAAAPAPQLRPALRLPSQDHGEPNTAADAPDSLSNSRRTLTDSLIRVIWHMRKRNRVTEHRISARLARAGPKPACVIFVPGGSNPPPREPDVRSGCGPVGNV
ncbi:hypothetical protein AAFF_G00133570 [Aldrovandia affinis]|uniref:Uncharacterized protein n=1 Tax=Aldrovandia affinis TaxID=143900 RepID=A0AAD7W935_9TELE|nr:hypothetical protein AAFF_G00133570 [Aldrovandia affinis]